MGMAEAWIHKVATIAMLEVVQALITAIKLGGQDAVEELASVRVVIP
jgi:hypothetical protein